MKFPQAKRAKREDVTDIYPQRLLDLGITFKPVQGKSEYRERLGMAFPDILNCHDEDPCKDMAHPFRFSYTTKLIKRIMGSDSPSYHWLLETFTEGNLVNGQSFPSPNFVDVYFPPKQFAQLPRLISTRIPRKFEPPLAAEKIREFYETLVSNGNEYLSELPRETFEDNDVYYVAFKDIYGHEPRPGVEYPLQQTIKPGFVIPFHMLCDTSSTRDFMKTFTNPDPLPPVIEYTSLKKSIQDLLIKALSPSLQSGMTQWLKDMENLSKYLPLLQDMKLDPSCYMQTLLDTFINCSNCDGHAGVIALEMSISSISIGAPKLKKHMIISGPPSSGKNMILNTHKKFTSVYSSSYTAGMWRTFAETVGQFNTVNLPEMPSHVRTKASGDFVEAGDTDQIIRDSIINVMDDEIGGHTRLAKNAEGEFERQTVGTQVPKMLLNVACNSYNIDSAVLSRFSLRYVYKDNGITDKNRQVLKGDDDTRYNHNNFFALRALFRTASWLPLLMELNFIPAPDKSIAKFQDQVFKKIRSLGSIVSLNMEGRVLQRVMSNAVYSQSVLRVVLSSIRDTNLSPEDIEKLEGGDWKTFVSQFLSHSATQWTVTLQDFIFAFTAEQVTLCRPHLRVLSLIRWFLYKHPKSANGPEVAENNNRVIVSNEHVNFRSDEDIVKKINSKYKIEYTKQQAGDIMKGLCKEGYSERYDGEGPWVFLPRASSFAHIDRSCLQQALTPVDHAILKYLNETPLAFIPTKSPTMDSSSYRDYRKFFKESYGIKSKSPRAWMPLHIAASQFPEFEFTYEIHIFEIYMSCDEKEWRGLGNYSLLMRQIPEILHKDERVVVVTSATWNSREVDVFLSKKWDLIKNILQQKIVEVVPEREKITRMKELVDASDKAADILFYPRNIMLVHVTDFFEHIDEFNDRIMNIFKDQKVKISLQDLYHYVQQLLPETKYDDIIDALVLIHHLNDVQLVFTNRKKVLELPFSSLYNLFKLHRGPIACMLDSMFGLTEEAERLTFYEAEPFKNGKQLTLKTIYYDPKKGEDSLDGFDPKKTREKHEERFTNIPWVDA